MISHRVRLFLRCGLLCTAAASAVFAFPSAGSLYLPPPSSAFVENAGETVVTVNDSSGSIATAQAALNSAHSGNPGAIVVLNLTGTYTVTTAPLNLTSHTCLVLQAHAIIQAGAGATASSLIQVAGQTNVSIAGGTLQGNGAALNAIKVTTSNRVRLDLVTVQNCGAAGISVAGNGNASFDNENTITRCEVSGCTDGIAISNGTQNLVLDNYCHDNTAAGINLATARSTAANNRCVGNAIGLLATGSYNKLADNTADSNPTGISLAAGGANNVAASNNISNCSTVGLSDAGTNDVIFQNAFTSTTTKVATTGTGANVVAWRGAFTASGQNYFYPPLIDDPHALTTIVNGLGRTDVTIGSTSLDSVQTQYNSAVSAHPGNVIVLHLTGTYSVGANPLTLGSNTVVILSGTIQENASTTTAASAVTLGASAVNVAFSGGTIDGGGRTTPSNGINFSGGNCVWVHATTIQNFGSPSTSNGPSNGLIKLGSMHGPSFISSSTTTMSGTRGIWTEGTGPFIITDCQSHSNNADGVDCDFTTQEALVKDSDLSSNARYGIFIEQEAKYNVAFNNDCSNGCTRGLAIFNNAEPASLPTAYNTVFCNVSDRNGNGIKSGAGGTASDGTTAQCNHNFAFNNILTNSTNEGLKSTQVGTENHYAQNIVSGNGTDYSTAGAETFFNPPAPPVVTADPTFSPGGGTYAGAQTVTIGTTTSGASIRYTTDGSTPTATTGTLYSGAVTVAATTTLKAIAFVSGAADSNVVTAVYTISSQVAAPAFSPGGGTYASAQTVTISTTTSGASIRYTTDGSTPTATTGTLYSTPVAISVTATLKAIAYKSGLSDSAVTSATYTISGGGPVTYEAEAQTIAATSGDTTTTNSEAGYSGGQAIQYSATAAGDFITFRLAGVAAGSYTVVVGYKTYTSRGIVQVSAGAAGGSLTNVGSAFDQYGASGYTSITLGTWTASTTGNQDFKFAVTGHNASSSGYSITIDYIRLTPFQPTLFEAETLGVSASSGDTSSINSEAGASNGQYLMYNSNAVGDSITLTLPNIAPGTYTLAVGVKKYTTRAIVQTNVGPAGGTLGAIGGALDLYASPSAFTEMTIGTWTIGTQGNKSVQFQVTGKNASSTGYSMAIDYIKLTP